MDASPSCSHPLFALSCFVLAYTSMTYKYTCTSLIERPANYWCPPLTPFFVCPLRVFLSVSLPSRLSCHAIARGWSSSQHIQEHLSDAPPSLSSSLASTARAAPLGSPFALVSST